LAACRSGSELSFFVVPPQRPDLLYNGAVDIARHRPGSVCISMLHTRDRDRASAFYTRLTGWSAQERDACTLFEQDGKVVAALTGNGADEWVPYVSVEDLDATIAAAMLLGAQAASRLVLPGVAQVAMLRDAEGARVGLWQPTPHQGAEMMEATGSLWWAEVLSDEPPRAKEFYSRLFGGRLRETAFEPFAHYTVFERDAVQEGGVLPIGKDWGVKPHWNSIFATDDCDKLLNRACALGGSIGFVHTVPKHGRLGSLIDPNGAWFWLRGPVPAATS
jgi:uncharacterized protein